MNTKEMIQGRRGYRIPVVHNITGDERAVVLISHGFGSSKESPTVRHLAKALKDTDMGYLAFDFPAHGQSPVDGEMFTLDNCLSDLSVVEETIGEKSPNATLFYFSSSFGAYMNLLYLTLCPHGGRKSFLRCPAVDMPRILRENMTPEIRKDLEIDGYTLLEEGFARPLRLTQAFYDQLQSRDLFKLYGPGDCEVMMIHGTLDRSASPEKTREFSEKFHIPLQWVEGADHTFSGDGMMDQVIDTALTFYSL